MRWPVAALAVMLGGCATVPGVQVVERIVYVPVPAELTQPHEVAEGPLSQCPLVANQRRQALEACNADKAAIAEIEGTDR
jgi:hypothetical protein